MSSVTSNQIVVTPTGGKPYAFGRDRVQAAFEVRATKGSPINAEDLFKAGISTKSTFTYFPILIEALHRLASDEPLEEQRPILTFEVGQAYKRADLHKIFGGQQRGGICTPKKYPIVVIFSGASGGEFGYKDGWKGDVFEYTGEGQVGDMVFAKGNKAIRDHARNGKVLHLFEVQKKVVRYAGEMVCAGYQKRSLPDRNGKERNAIVFELRAKADANKKKAEEEAKDASFQQLVDYAPPARELPAGPIQPPAPAKQAGSVKYPRNPTIAKRRLEEVGYVCEVDPAHITFMSRATEKPYIEAHHLVPVGRQGDFPHAALDVPENILALCPLCHRKFHHAVQAPQFELIDRFLTSKRVGLEKRGIIISRQALREYYSADVILEE